MYDTLDLHAHQFRHAKASHWLEDGLMSFRYCICSGMPSCRQPWFIWT